MHMNKNGMKDLLVLCGMAGMVAMTVATMDVPPGANGNSTRNYYVYNPTAIDNEIAAWQRNAKPTGNDVIAARMKGFMDACFSRPVVRNRRQADSVMHDRVRTWAIANYRPAE
ncbi:hypothetical protein SAMN04487825_10939 [Prevotella sp. kh1p2]|nr:hypothetical protein SAMN04487825_10939 [Prevotella sp. kh1p2]SNU11285.1 hypothetical protein SAMN06298210_10939 [Prevotellaceae bacterium KH2P17]